MQTVLQLPPRKDNPRNSEGDFIELYDGRLLFIYTHFTKGDDDHAGAFLAGRYSEDGGETWTGSDIAVISNEGKLNVMSVSLVRLKDDRIALFYMRKHSLSDCRPVVRFSGDEAETWSDSKCIIPDSETGYYVLNNDRAFQLASGRLIIPVSRHDTPQGRWTGASMYGTIMCCYSDDAGCTWRRSRTQPDGVLPEGTEKDRIMLQEPGIAELKDGRLMMFCRTDSGSQYVSFSNDRGESWTVFKRSNIISPRSPASIKRIPRTGDLILVWNNHMNISRDLKDKRTPLCAAVSRDEGMTWENVKELENNPNRWYCYTAVYFSGDNVLLAYCAGDRRKNNGLAETHIVRFPLEWLYSD